MSRSITNKGALLKAELEIEGYYAIRDVDTAEKYLQTLLTMNSKDYTKTMYPGYFFKKHEVRKIYANDLGTATRRLWQNTSRYCVDIDRVHNNFVPLLGQAASKILFKGKWFNQVRDLIRRRINDLEENHCCGVFLEQKV